MGFAVSIIFTYSLKIDESELRNKRKSEGKCKMKMFDKRLHKTRKQKFAQHETPEMLGSFHINGTIMES